MKQYLLTTSLGRVAILIRDQIAMVREALFAPEVIGTLANDLLAMKLITSLCRPNMTFIDVGAHIGSVISQVKFHTPSVRLIAIEAIPEKSEKLRRRFPFAEIHSCAAGETVGMISFFIDINRSGYSSLAKPTHIINDRSTTEITVPITRLDEIVHSSNIDAIKIDVEGAELGVLRGSTKILERCRPTIMFESGPPSEDGLGYSKEALYDFLKSNDFSVLVPNRLAHDGPGLTLEGFLESHWFPRRTTNYFAIPNEQRTQIRDRARSILDIPST